jgi:hypothetical protein
MGFIYMLSIPSKSKRRFRRIRISLRIKEDTTPVTPSLPCQKELNISSRPPDEISVQLDDASSCEADYPTISHQEAIQSMAWCWNEQDDSRATPLY